MNQEELRLRLIELVKPFVSGCACEYESGSCELTDCRSCNAQNLADHLIENSVTIRERGYVVEHQGHEDDYYCECSVCKTHEVSLEDNFCPHCGADIRCGVMLDETVKPRKNIEFETGDIAKIVGNTTAHGFKIGTIVRLEKCKIDYKAFVGDKFWWVVDDDLEPIEDADMRGEKDE